MIRMILRAAIYLISAAIGLLVATAVLDDMTVTAGGFVLAVVVFALCQLILTPFILKVVHRNAPAFMGGVGIVSTLVALIIGSLASDSISISGASTWFLAAVIVWFVTAIATLVVPYVLVKLGVNQLREDDN